MENKKNVPQVKITDDDLNTKTDLVTEEQNFELLGLKDHVDLRRFSRNWVKADNLFTQLLSKIFVPSGEEEKF